MKNIRNLSLFVLTFLSISLFSFYGCQKEQVKPSASTTELEIESRGAESFFSVVYWRTKHGSMTIKPYALKARLSGFPLPL